MKIRKRLDRIPANKRLNVDVHFTVVDNLLSVKIKHNILNQVE